jgi:signal transduction histidine kinase
MSDDGKVNILLVDDRPDKLLALEAVLEDLDQNVVRAYSGREALRHLLTTDFAVILLDVNMPGMDGFETAQLIRQRRSSEHIPIIFITAFGDEMLVSRGYSLGAVDYIQTPVVPEVLRSKVAVFVDLFRKSAQVQRQAESLRRRAHQLQKLAAASVAINGALSIDRMLQTITETARDVIGAHQAITVFIDPRPGQRQPRTQSFTSYSEKYADWRGKLLHLDAVASTIAFRSHSATRMTESELRDHPDWEVVRRLEVPPVRGMLAAPLSGRDGTRLGIIYLSDRESGHFSADDEVILVQLSQMASIAIENTLFAEEREANRIKDEFLATLSHELRTPLNAILGWTQLLLMNKPTGELARGLEVIHRNVKAQTKLIEDLLDVSRITTGKLRLNVRPVYLGPLITSAIDGVQPSADARGVQLGSNLEPLADHPVMGDADRLQQVVWNLLSNAVKFTATGGSVHVTGFRSGHQVTVQVTDSGQGIPAEFLPFVFDRFRQADSSSTRSHGGLGLGLTIVRAIIEMHGGSVRAESGGEGRGSTFTFTLPVAAVRPEAKEGGSALTAPARIVELGGEPTSVSEDGGSLAKVHVLLVDDEADALELTAEILRRCGARVTTAGSAAEARELLQRQRPDVLVSDIAMPGEDGFALLQSVRMLPPELGGSVPAVAMTAYAREEDRARSLAAGFRCHIPKPIDPPGFVAALAELAREGASRRTEAPEDAAALSAARGG